MERADAVGRVVLLDNLASAMAPRWFEGLLWFSDSAAGAVHTVNLAAKVSTLDLPGHRPTGLGFRDGTLLIASAGERVLLRYDGESTGVAADLSGVVPADLGELVVDQRGRIYVACVSDHGALAKVESDGSVDIVADDLNDPAGMVITGDGRTLIVAESTARRLIAFTIEPDGSLSGRRTITDRLVGPPGGLCADADQGLWVAMTSAHQFQRIGEDGSVSEQIGTADRSAVACALGGSNRRLLFLVSEGDPPPGTTSGIRRSDIAVAHVHGLGAGLL